MQGKDKIKLKMKVQKLSVIIIAKDEEENIKDCLESVKWAEEIVVVVDDRTTDKTAEIAKKYTDKVFRHRFEGFGKQCQYALRQAQGDWVLKLDADERITPELKKEILEKIELKEFVGFHTFFHTWFLGKELILPKKGVQGTVRLFKREKAHFLPVKVHERVEVEGKVGILENRILHYSHRTFFQTMGKFNLYTSYEAEELFKAGGRTNLFFIFLVPFYYFIKQLFSWGAWRQGRYGIIMGMMAGMYHLLKHLKIWELQQKNEICFS